MDKKHIKQTIALFREHYKLIQEIDKYEYNKLHFIGNYDLTPTNDVELIFNQYISENNIAVENEIKRLKSLSVSGDLIQYTAIKIQILEKCIYGSKKIFSTNNTSIAEPDGITTLSIYEQLKNLRDEFKQKYREACDKHIEALELKAVELIFLTNNA